MSALAEALDGSALARWVTGASVTVVLAAGLVAAGLAPAEHPRPRPVPPISIVASPQASTSGTQATAVTVLATTIPVATPTTAPPRTTPPYQVVPDDPSADVPPPVRGIDPISGD